MTPITRAAVLGAGTMGSRIAAHLANAGIPTLLLDLASPPPDRSRLARTAWEGLVRQKPAPLFDPEYLNRITVGNFEEDLGGVRECDWIIEAVAENLAVKRQLLERVAPLRAPHAVVSTNTSGISVASIAEGFPEDFRRRFLGVHFFNPPRYLYLVEVVPGPDTLSEVVDWVSGICDLRLGKGVVRAKDTPNFIANRIGIFAAATALQLMMRDGFTVEEVDALTGPAIGNPKSATFRTLDIVGLDVAAAVMRNLADTRPDDPRHERLQLPPFLDEMLAQGWVGEKAGRGFYRKRQEIEVVDWRTLGYRPRQKPRFPSLEAAKNFDSARRRLPVLVGAGDRAGGFLWNLLSEVFCYAASLLPEISDRIVEIDRAMRWGFGQELGPFEAWDALGVETVVTRLREEKREVPLVVERMLACGAKSFYQGKQYYDLVEGGYRPLEPRPGLLILKEVREGARKIKGNAGASLLDLEDGVLGVEFHSKMNTIGEDQIGMLLAGVRELANFDAMVVANQGEQFSVGANLVLVLLAAQNGEWEDLDLGVRRFQQANLALKYAPKPVVAAPFGQTLGGGAEISLHCGRVHAGAELYMGLVEVGVGVIPAAGGTKELLLRMVEGAPPDGDLLPRVQRAFETIGYAKVSTSAEEARRMGFLRPSDPVTMNRERLVAEAKATALDLARSYRPPSPPCIPVLGESGLAALNLAIYLARKGGFITDYDAVIARRLAGVLSGGRLSGQPVVSEQYLLDLEREAFLSLCGERKTQERMQHLLRTGKPLRN
jgi:3-hydroxyacyl-CoA dehydrogenase